MFLPLKGWLNVTSDDRHDLIWVVNKNPNKQTNPLPPKNNNQPKKKRKKKKQPNIISWLALWFGVTVADGKIAISVLKIYCDASSLKLC